MEKHHKPAPTLDETREMTPGKGALYSSVMNGLSNALFFATPVGWLLGQDKGTGRITKTLNGETAAKLFGEKAGTRLFNARQPVTITLGAVAAAAGIVQGICEANNLQRYREAKHDYNQHQDNLIHEQGERIATLEKALDGKWQARINGETKTTEQQR